MDHKSVFAVALVISFIAPLFLAIPSADAESVESELIFTYTNPESDTSQESAVAVSENGNTAVVLSSGEKNFLVFDMQQKIVLWRTSHSPYSIGIGNDGKYFATRDHYGLNYFQQNSSEPIWTTPIGNYDHCGIQNAPAGSVKNLCSIHFFNDKNGIMLYIQNDVLRTLFFDSTGPLEELFFNKTYSMNTGDLRNNIFFLETGFAIAEYVDDMKFNVTFVTEDAQKSEVILIENRTDIIGISDNGRYIVSTVFGKNTLYVHDKTKSGIFEEDRIYYFEGGILNQPGAVFLSDKDFLIFEGDRATSLNYDNFDNQLISQEEGEVAVLNPSFVGYGISYYNSETHFFGKTPDEKYLFLYPYTEGGDNRNIVHLFNTEWSGSWDTTKSCYDDYVSYRNGCDVVFTGSDNKYTAFMINSAGFEVYSISIDESFVASMSTEDQDFLVVCCGIIIVIFIIFVAIIKSDYFDLSKSEMVKNIILASALIPILWVLDMLDLFSMLGLFALALLFISYLRRDNTDSLLSHSPEMYGQQQQQQQQQQQLRFTPKAELVNIECPGCSSQMKVPKLNELQNVECKECGLAGEIKV